MRTWEVRLAVLVRRGDEMLLVRRAHDARVLPGTWMLPEVLLHSESPLPRRRELNRFGALDDASQRLTDAYGGRWTLSGPEVRVRHGITHRSIDLLGRPAQFEGVLREVESSWCGADGLAELHTSSMLRKLLTQFDRLREV